MNVASSFDTTLSLSSSSHHDQRNALHLLLSECADVDSTSPTGHVFHTFSLQLSNTVRKYTEIKRNEWIKKVINIKKNKIKEQTNNSKHH